jgi:hypothetical protein
VAWKQGKSGAWQAGTSIEVGDARPYSMQIVAGSAVQACGAGKRKEVQHRRAMCMCERREENRMCLGYSCFLGQGILLLACWVYCYQGWAKYVM